MPKPNRRQAESQAGGECCHVEITRRSALRRDGATAVGS
jgi:hypothetical protein